MDGIRTTTPRGAWNKGKLVGQKAPFKLPLLAVPRA